MRPRPAPHRAAASAVSIGISNCSSTTSLSATTARTSADVEQVRVGAGRHDDGVLGRAVDQDRGRAAGPWHRHDAVQSDVVVAQVGAQLVGGRVVAQRRDQLHRGARAGGGDRLIAALAAGGRRRRRCENRLAGPGSASTVNVRSSVDAAHHADPSHHDRQR